VSDGVPLDPAEGDVQSASELLAPACLVDEEAVEGVVVLAAGQRLGMPSAGPPGRALAPAVQAAAVAAGGFLAGAAIVGLVQRRHSATTARRRAPAGRLRRGSAGQAAELIQIVGSRSLLVDVHLLGGPAKRR
jgi:hypothetical protein